MTLAAQESVTLKISQTSEVILLTKSRAAASGVTKFKTVNVKCLVTLCCAGLCWRSLYMITPAVLQCNITFLTFTLETLGGMTQIGSFLLAKVSK